jgi:3-deoxy-7-phosphoheptulonate synthase
MIVVMKPSSTDDDIARVVKLLEGMGTDHSVIEGAGQTVVEVYAAGDHVDRSALESVPNVDRVLEKSEPFLAARRQPDDSTFEIPLGAKATVGGRKLAAIAGPCSVESKTQLLEIAAAVSESGAVALRGGAFKPRTSPYSFQGLGEAGLEALAMAREETGLAIVTEVLCCEHIELVSKYADVVQVGSRNMHQSHLLRTVGRQSKPVLLKRGWSSTLEEFLMAAEYIMCEGNRNVILCERGIRSHETYVRNTLALAVVPEVKRRSRLPIIVDPSHGTGRRHLVQPMSQAAIACGADGLIVEVHADPDHAWSDGNQTIDPEQFRSMMQQLRRVAEACDRVI